MYGDALPKTGNGPRVMSRGLLKSDNESCSFDQVSISALRLRESLLTFPFIPPSGGKDSCYCMMRCVAVGHQIVALANLQPAKQVGKSVVCVAVVLSAGLPVIVQ